MKKMIMKNNILLLVSMVCIIVFSSCDSKYEAKDPYDTETMNSGRIDIYCEDDLYDLFDTTFSIYEKDYQKVLLTRKKVTSRNAMASLLAGDARLIISSRNYLSDEDSLMKVYKVAEHSFMDIAEDALVFYVKKDFPKDTLNTLDLKQYLIGSKSTLYDDIKISPTFILPNQNSSVYANFYKKVMDTALPLPTRIKIIDNVLEKLDANSIGVGYLSSVLKDTTLKCLQLSYIDSAGIFIRPKPVHQSYIVLGKYPYPVKIRVLLLKENRDLAFWFASYIAKETRVQKYLKDNGIVPAFAKFKLKVE